MSLLTVFFALASILYLSATVAVISRLFHPSGPQKVTVLSLGGFAVCIHILALTSSVFSNQSIDFSLLNVVSLVALIISLGMTITAIKHKVNLILPVVYGFSALLLCVLAFIPQMGHLIVDTSKIILVIHVILALVAYCILVIATLYSFQVAFINYKLKQKNLIAVNHLPPLMQVERQLFIIMIAGTIVLSLSQLVGLLFIDNFFAKAQIHKTVLSVFALLFYMFILWAHFTKGWRGKIIMTLTASATAILTLAYFGSRFVKEFLLS